MEIPMGKKGMNKWTLTGGIMEIGNPILLHILRLEIKVFGKCNKEEDSIGNETYSGCHYSMINNL